MALKLAVIVDGETVQRFALDALDAVLGTDEIAVFSCTNTRTPKRWLRHGAYYALNLVTVRNRLTRSVRIDSGKKSIVARISFESKYDGAWQVLPSDIIEELRSGGFNVILKLGMGLLRVPPADQLPVPILSYHHGDPDRYRGRPAGFWEIAEGEPLMGQVVQVIGNQLDAGRVVAFAQTKVFPWSYRATLMEAYRRSPLIINTAIRNALANRCLPKPSTGRNCRLPSNATVLVFTARMARQSVRRLFYGAFMEKIWRVSTASLRPRQLSHVLQGSHIPPPSDWSTLTVAPGYTFYADPFFAKHGRAVLVEALRARSGIGEIVMVDDAGHRPLIAEGGHMSYPATAVIGGREVIVPETAGWSSPRLYVVEAGSARHVSTISIAGTRYISDPTIVEHEGKLYLFGNDREIGSNVLSLWLSDSLQEEFRPHPASPIRISPEGSRMGGNIVEQDGRLFRFGQDFSGAYGDGLFVFEIVALSPSEYSEELVGRIRFDDRRGPHTLNVREDQMVFDWYSERLSPFAGLRRLAAILQRRRPQATQ